MAQGLDRRELLQALERGRTPARVLAEAVLQVERLDRAAERVAASAPGTPRAAPPTSAASIVVGGERFTDFPTMAGLMM